MTAIRQFKAVADQFEFPGEEFPAYASDFFVGMIRLLKEVSNDEARLKRSSKPCALSFRGWTPAWCDLPRTSWLCSPEMWELSDDQAFMIKQAILAIATALVMSMGEASQQFQPLMLPLLREAMAPDSALHLYLLEEIGRAMEGHGVHEHPTLRGGSRSFGFQWRFLCCSTRHPLPRPARTLSKATSSSPQPFSRTMACVDRP